MNIKTIYTICSKRRGRAKWKLSVNVSLLVKENGRIPERVPVRLVYIPNAPMPKSGSASSALIQIWTKTRSFVSMENAGT